MPADSASLPRTDRPERTVAVIGASPDPTRFSYQSIQAHRRAGFTVYPVNPRGGEIDGLNVWRSVEEVPVPLDRVTMYVSPKVGLELLPQIARKGCRELWFNPGSESDEVVAEAIRLGLNPIVACSIVDVHRGG